MTEIERLTRHLIDQRKLIEAGFIAMRVLAIPADAPPVQIDAMREAFFAGAQHLFGSIMTILDRGTEPTDNDIRRMNWIDAELQNFIEVYAKKHNLPPSRT